MNKACALCYEDSRDQESSEMGAYAPRKLKHCGATGKKPVAPQALRLLLLLPN
jgi:hypothetical protein